MLEFLHLNFVYHVVHHIFPSVSPRFWKQIHRELVKQFPNEYKIMPKWQAMRMLYKTARIYKTSRLLYNPETAESYPTI